MQGSGVLLARHFVMWCADGEGQEQGIYAFCTEALVTAGEWTAVVEYAEQRPELSKALTKREAVLRSTAATFQVRQLWLITRPSTCVQSSTALPTLC